MQRKNFRTLEESVDLVLNRNKIYNESYSHKKCKHKTKKKCKKVCDEDEENLSNVNPESVKSAIVNFMSNDIDAATNGTNLNVLLNLFQTFAESEKREIVRIVQQMINDGTLNADKNTKKIYLVQTQEDEEGFVEPMDFVDTTIKDDIINYFNNSVSGTMTGISFNQIIRDIGNNHGYKKQEIVATLKELLDENIIKPGKYDGTLIINDDENELQFDDTDEMTAIEDEEQIVVPYVTSSETPETLKAKGWVLDMDGTFINPNGTEKCIIATENNKININNSMYDEKYEKLLEEFANDFDNIGIDEIDNTDGLDEFGSEDEIGGDEGESVTITLSGDEAKFLTDILTKLQGESEDEMTDEDSDSDFGDDDLNIDMGDEDSDSEFGDEDEENEECEEDEDEEDEDDSENFNYDEDEESLADAVDMVYNGSGRKGAPSTQKNTPPFDSKRKPIENEYYKPNTDNVYDGGGRKGDPTTQKNTPPFDSKRKPVPSRNTNKAGKKESIFN